jgi:putative ABC transport system ATP-binding protein
MTVIVGPSGSGKTTLLNLIAGLDRPSGGQVHVLGRDLNQMSERQRLEFRLHHLSIIFQSFGLLPLLTARENVSVPLRMRNIRPSERDTRVDQALAWVGLSDRVHHRPYELSGGEQQRVAIARSLVGDPAVVLADEPTGQLDSHTGRLIVGLLRRFAIQRGAAVVITTHDPQVMAEADVVHELRDGKLTRSFVKAGVMLPTVSEGS